MQIHPIDPKTLQDGFYVTPTGLPSYNKSLLVGTDPKEKEAKRLKVLVPCPTLLHALMEHMQKEQRRAEKEKARLLQQQQQHYRAASTPGAGAASTPHATTATTAAGTPVPRTTGSTPAPGIPPKFKSRGSPHPGTPRILASGSYEPPKQAGQGVAMPATGAGRTKTVVNGVGTQGEKRGIKREGTPMVPMEATATGGFAGQQRPLKKRRIVGDPFFGWG